MGMSRATRGRGRDDGKGKRRCWVAKKLVQESSPQVLVAAAEASPVGYGSAVGEDADKSGVPLGGICVGDTVQDKERRLVGEVRALSAPADALVDFPRVMLRDDEVAQEASICLVPVKRLTVARRDGFHLGQLVAWRFADKEIPRGVSLKVAAFVYRDGASVVICRRRGTLYGMSAGQLLDREPRQGIHVGDKVRWRSSDEDLPPGSVGTVLGFSVGRRRSVVVEFGDGRPPEPFKFRPEQLEVVERHASDPSSSDADMDSLGPPRQRPPCYPFEANHTLGFDEGKVHIHLTRASKAPVLGLMVFCPGTHGGIGPCRAPGANFDPDGLFPTLARQLADEGVFSCRVCWQAMHPPLEEAMKGTVLAVHYALKQMAHQGGANTRFNICVVGHSLGGAVALRVAAMLREVLPGMQAKHLGGASGADLQGVITLAAQERGAARTLSGLEGVPKVFIHGTADTILPVQSAQRLYDAAPHPKEVEILDGGEHDLFTYKAHLLERVRRFALEAFTSGGKPTMASRGASPEAACDANL